MPDNEKKQADNVPEERFTKIKVKDGNWFFAWEEKNEKTKSWDAYSFKSNDIPRPELCERLQTLKNHVVKICELDDNKAKKIGISGITISYNDNGNRFLVISGERYLDGSKSPLIFNTPPRPQNPDNCSVDCCMSDELTRDLESLVMEAEFYIRGDRAQGKLDFGESNAGGIEQISFSENDGKTIVTLDKQDRQNIIDVTERIMREQKKHKKDNDIGELI